MFLIILAFIKRASHKKRTGLLAIKSTACARVIRLAKHTKGHFLREEARTGFLEKDRNFLISESLLPTNEVQYVAPSVTVDTSAGEIGHFFG